MDSAILDGRRTSQSRDTWVLINASAERFSREQMADEIFTAYLSAVSGIPIDAPYHAAIPCWPGVVICRLPQVFNLDGVQAKRPEPLRPVRPSHSIPSYIGRPALKPTQDYETVQFVQQISTRNGNTRSVVAGGTKRAGGRNFLLCFPEFQGRLAAGLSSSL